MGLGDKIEYLILADEGQAIGAFGRVGQAMVKTTQQAEAEQKRLQAAIDTTTAKAKVAAAEQAKLSAKAGKAGAAGDAEGAAVFAAKADAAGVKAAQLGKQVEGAQADIAALGTTAESSGGALASMGISGAAAPLAIAAAAGIALTEVEKFAKAGIDSYVSQVLEARNLSIAMGTNITDASKLAAVARGLEIDVDSLVTGEIRLGKNIEDSTAKFAAHGVAIARAKNGSVDLTGTLVNVADAYQKAGGGAQGNALAVDLLGKGVKELLPLLAANRQQIEQLIQAAQQSHSIFTPADVQAVVAYKVATNTLHNELTGLGREMAGNVVPNLAKIAFGAEDVAKWLDRSGVAAAAFKASAALLGPVLGPLALILEHLGSAQEKKAAADEKQREVDQQKAADAQTLIGTLTAQADATEKLTADGLDLADAEANLTRVQNTGVGSTQDLADKRAALVAANQSLADAEAKLAQVKADSGAVDRELADDEIALEKAREAGADAAINLREAEDALAVLKEKGAGAGSLALQKAEAAVAKAKTEGAQASEDSAKSEAELAKDRAGGTDAAKALTDAENAVGAAMKTAASARAAVDAASDDIAQHHRDVERAALAVGAAAKQQGKDQADSAGDAETAVTASVQAQLAEYQKLIATLDPKSDLYQFVAAQIVQDEKLITDLAGIPGLLDIATGQVGAFSTLVNQTKALFPDGGSGAPSKPSTVDKVVDFAKNLGKISIPGFDEGGIVPGPIGKAVPAIVHGGEEVLTPAQRRRGTATEINVNINAAMTEQALARAAAAGVTHALASAPLRVA